VDEIYPAPGRIRMSTNESMIYQTSKLISCKGKNTCICSIILAYLTNNSGTFSEWSTRRQTHLMHGIAA
jgi:hypothetical protein